MKTTRPTDEEISRRAHEIWIKRGREEGQAEEHWYQAERELMRTGVPSVAAKMANDPRPPKRV